MRTEVRAVAFLAGWILFSVAGYVAVSEEFGLLVAMLYLPVTAVVPNLTGQLSTLGENVR